MEINGLILIEQNKLQELIKAAVEDALQSLYKHLQPKPDDTLLTRKEAATLLSVSPNTMSRYVRQGKLKPSVINGKYRFKKGDVSKFVSKQQV
jgi:excisionase family DNA binding protein